MVLPGAAIQKARVSRYHAGLLLSGKQFRHDIVVIRKFDSNSVDNG